jgi:hypothetical protein
MTSFRGEVKLWVPCKILWHVKEPCKYEKIYFVSRIHSHSLQVSPVSLLGVSACNCQRALVDKSGMIRIQMGAHVRSDMAAVHGMPFVIPPHNSNSNPHF